MLTLAAVAKVNLYIDIFETDYQTFRIFKI